MIPKRSGSTRLDDEQLGMLVYGLYQTKRLVTGISEDDFYTELFHISANFMRKKFGDINDELTPYMAKRRPPKPKALATKPIRLNTPK